MCLLCSSRIGPGLETQNPDTLFFSTRLGLPTRLPSLWGPGSPSTLSQEAQTRHWPVVDGPANAGGRAAPGRTAKPQPVPEAQASVPRQGGEDGQGQDAEVYAAAGAAHGILGHAGVGPRVLALWAEEGSA